MNDSEFAKDVVCELSNRNETISVMESCTGGYISSCITDVTGCSHVFSGGYVTYTNEQKIVCGVPKDIIEDYGVYSEECALAMAKAATKNTNSRFAIGITGTLTGLDKSNSDSKSGHIFYAFYDRCSGVSKTDEYFLGGIVLLATRRIQKNVIAYKVFEEFEKFMGRL